MGRLVPAFVLLEVNWSGKFRFVDACDRVKGDELALVVHFRR